MTEKNTVEYVYTCELTTSNLCEQIPELSCATCPIARRKIIDAFIESDSKGGQRISFMKPNSFQLIGVLGEVPMDDEIPVHIVYVREGRIYDLSNFLYSLSLVRCEKNIRNFKQQNA